MKNSGMALRIALAGVGLFIVACGSSTQQGSSDNSGSTSSSASTGSSSSSGGGAAGGAGGSNGGAGGEAGANPAGNGGAGATGGNGTGGTAGGNAGYATCDECTSDKGAPMNECLAEYMACMEWKSCVSIMNCNTAGTPGGPGPCDKSTVKGACCSIQCEGQLMDPEGVTRYRALDACIHCKTCGALCNTGATYCSVFEPGGEMLCK